MREKSLYTICQRAGLACVMLLHIGCAEIMNTTSVASKSPSSESIPNSTATKSKSSYDFSMLQAADLMNQGQFLEAGAIYQKLYKQTKEPYFMKQVALTQSQAGEIEAAAQTAKQYQTLSKDVDDFDTNLIIAEDHLQKKQYNLAIILLEQTLTRHDTLQIHYILSNLYMQQGQPQKALKHFISIYNDEMSAETKLRLEAFNNIVSIYLQNKEVDKALEYLNGYIANNEYSLNLENFFTLYAKLDKLEMLQESLKKRFMEDKNVENARMLIAILAQQNHYKEAATLLKEYESNLGIDGKEMLMQVFAEDKQYSEAMKMARSLYEQTDRTELLGMSAIYEYEGMNPKTKKSLQSVVQTLQTMIAKRNAELQSANGNLTQSDAFFYNFLGYLMINHDINIDEGMQYVSKALAVEPTSIEYLDSLAWGFYKKGDCKQAQETFSLIAEDKMKQIPELIEHEAAIKACKQ